MSYLKHIGTPRHSGRYPWGSGDEPYQSHKSFRSMVSDLEKKGLSQKEIAESLGMNTTELKRKKTLERLEQINYDMAFAQRLKDKGYSHVAIGKRMGKNESSIRSLLDPGMQERAEAAYRLADALQERIDAKKFIDVGAGTEVHLGINRNKLDTALDVLQEDGYNIHVFPITQLGTGKNTIMKVITPPDITDEREVRRSVLDGKLEMVVDLKTRDHGETWTGLEPVAKVNGDRVLVRYKEDGGHLKDGIIELRPNVPDLDLGKNNYAQVRISVDGTHFLKGMAIYGTDFPNGVDIIYNSKKGKDVKKYDVFKKNEDTDPTNPFGAAITQKIYIDKDGKQHVSALNYVNEEGDWDNWAKTLSSQFLSKQTPQLAKKQLDAALSAKQDEFDEIMSLTNPVVKKRLLDSFADDADSAAVHLKAASLPKEGTHVILPFNSIKDTEVFAPNYDNGTRVVLVRYPHGGIFEIPELIVNNKNKEALAVMSASAKDAIGINPKTAQKLSGADFDGDTVLVIPNNNREIRTADSLKGLKDFDPQETYKHREGAPIMYEAQKQREMGSVSNLITDMTIKGASPDELARAVRHSMVVIDAVKHKLDYKRSAIENDIPGLKTKYQGGPRSGASTLISRASSEERVPHRKERGLTTTRLNTDPRTGEKIYKYTGKTYVRDRKVLKNPETNLPERDPITGKKIYVPLKNPKVIQRQTISTKMYERKDARELSSGSPIEEIYADYANNLKALANKARKESLRTPNLKYSPTAKTTYENEVKTLDAKLREAYRNKPLERKAQLVAAKNVQMKKLANPFLEKEDLKKIRGMQLVAARNRIGAKKTNVEITDREWEAIQAGAISHNKLARILLNTDLDAVKQRALPRTTPYMSPGKINRAQTMLAAGRTRSEIAASLGVSLNTLNKVLE